MKMSNNNPNELAKQDATPQRLSEFLLYEGEKLNVVYQAESPTMLVEVVTIQAKKYVTDANPDGYRPPSNNPYIVRVYHMDNGDFIGDLVAVRLHGKPDALRRAHILAKELGCAFKIYARVNQQNMDEEEESFTIVPNEKCPGCGNISLLRNDERTICHICDYESKNVQIRIEENDFEESLRLKEAAMKKGLDQIEPEYYPDGINPDPDNHAADAEAETRYANIESAVREYEDSIEYLKQALDYTTVGDYEALKNYTSLVWEAINNVIEVLKNPFKTDIDYYLAQRKLYEIQYQSKLQPRKRSKRTTDLTGCYGKSPISDAKIREFFAKSQKRQTAAQYYVRQVFPVRTLNPYIEFPDGRVYDFDGTQRYKATEERFPDLKRTLEELELSATDIELGHKILLKLGANAPSSLYEVIDTKFLSDGEIRIRAYIRHSLISDPEYILETAKASANTGYFVEGADRKRTRIALERAIASL